MGAASERPRPGPCRRRLLGGSIGLLIAALATPSAHAGQVRHECRRQDAVRYVDYVFAETPERVPCEVLSWQYRDGAWASERLWRADNQGDFCPAREDELLETLAQAGWQCREVEVPAQGDVQQ